MAKRDKHQKGADRVERTEAPAAPPEPAPEAQTSAPPAEAPAASPAGDVADEEPDPLPGPEADLEADAKEDAPRLTLEELRGMGVIAAESADRGGFVDVVTKGGRKLRFPGDEERAAALTPPELTGEPLKAPDVASGTLQPRTLRDLQELDCIAAQRYDTATRQTVVVTKGGRKLRFPGDEALAGRLTDSELDGIARKAWPRVNEKTSLLGKPIKD